MSRRVQMRKQRRDSLTCPRHIGGSRADAWALAVWLCGPGLNHSTTAPAWRSRFRHYRQRDAFTGFKLGSETNRPGFGKVTGHRHDDGSEAGRPRRRLLRSCR